MTADDFPADVGQFITEHINSVGQLEVLLLLRSSGDRAWTAVEISEALRTTSDMATEQLRELTARGIVSASEQSPTQYRYVPPEAARSLIDRLAILYDERRVTVITLIYSKPTDKVRTFADAFRLRKER